MSEARITEQLRLRLDEVSLVYEQLPITLERARKVIDRGPWNTFFHDQATALKSQLQALRAAASVWGKRTRPFFSPEVDEQLNEALHAVRSRRAASPMEDKVRQVVSVLRARVLTRLEEAIDLAMRIREHDLALRLRDLHQDERSQQTAMEEAGAGA